MICHGGHEGAVCGADVCTYGGCGASELAGGGNGLHVGGTIGGVGGDGSGLVSSNAGCMNLLFLCIWYQSWSSSVLNGQHVSLSGILVAWMWVSLAFNS